MLCSLAFGKQKCGLVLVMVIAGLLAVISLSVVLVQINSQKQCQLCDDVSNLKLSRGKNMRIDHLKLNRLFSCTHDWLAIVELSVLKVCVSVYSRTLLISWWFKINDLYITIDQCWWFEQNNQVPYESVRNGMNCNVQLASNGASYGADPEAFKEYACLS